MNVYPLHLIKFFNGNLLECLHKWNVPKWCSTCSPQIYITKTRSFKYIENFTSKNWQFSDKINNFHISA